MNKEFWILKEQGSNRALIRESGEKWDGDINGEPGPKWIHVIEYKKPKDTKIDDHVLFDIQSEIKSLKNKVKDLEDINEKEKDKNK